MQGGQLVKVELVPAAAGGHPVPENLVFLPPEAAERKGALDARALAALPADGATHYAAVPEYRGPSVVPARIRMLLRGPAGEQQEVLEVW